MDLDLKPSKQIQGATYDTSTKTLTLDLNGGSYSAKGVPHEDVVNLVGAPSHGYFFHKVLKVKHKFTKD